MPSSIPIMKTIGNSSPLAACKVIKVNSPCWSISWLSKSDTNDKSVIKPIKASSSAGLLSITPSSSAWIPSRSNKLKVPSGLSGLLPGFTSLWLRLASCNSVGRSASSWAAICAACSRSSCSASQRLSNSWVTEMNSWILSMRASASSVFWFSKSFK